MPSLKLDQTTPQRKSPRWQGEQVCLMRHGGLTKQQSLGASKGRCPSRRPSWVSWRLTPAIQDCVELQSSYVSFLWWWREGERIISLPQKNFHPPIHETLNGNVFVLLVKPEWSIYRWSTSPLDNLPITTPAECILGGWKCISFPFSSQSQT